MAATALAARATLAGERVPTASRDIYLRLGELGTPQEQARALSNLAVLRAEMGVPEAAMSQWTDALAFDHAVNIIRLDDRVHGHDMGGLTLTAEVDRVYWLVLSPYGRELPTP